MPTITLLTACSPIGSILDAGQFNFHGKIRWLTPANNANAWKSEFLYDVATYWGREGDRPETCNLPIASDGPDLISLVDNGATEMEFLWIENIAVAVKILQHGDG
jgi:hypothetical protein